MAGYSLCILFVEAEVQPRIELFSGEEDHFSYVVTTIPGSDLSNLHASSLAEEYDVIIIDRRGPSPVCPDQVRDWLTSLEQQDIDVLLLVTQKDPTLIEMLADNGATTSTINYLVEPISPVELSAVTQRLAGQRKKRQFYEETNEVVEQLTVLDALKGPEDSADFLEAAMKKVVTIACRAAVQMFGVKHSGCVKFEWDHASDQPEDHAVIIADFPDLPHGLLVGREIPVKNVPIEERLLLEKKTIEIYDVRAETGLGKIRDLLLGLDIQSMLLIPVLVNGRVVASFSLDSVGKQRRFSPGEIDLCEKLAAQVGLIISKIEKEQEANAMRRAWRAAQEIAQVAAQGHVDKTMQCIVQGITQKLHGEIATLYIYDDDLEVKRFTRRYVDGCDPDNAVEPHKATHNSALGRIIELEGTDSYFSENAASDNTFNGQFVQKEQIKTAFGMRLRYGEQVVGVLFISYRGKKHLAQYEINSFLAFGYQAAVSVKTALLNEQAHRQRQMLDSLYAAGEIYASNSNTDDALTRIVRVAHQAVASQSAGERLVSHLALVQGDQLCFEAAWPPENLALLDGKVNEVCIDPARLKSLAARAVIERKTQLEQDASSIDCYIPCFEGVNAQISVPLWAGETIIGVLTVEKQTPPYITQQDRQILEHLASHATSIIQSSRHLRLVRSLLSAWSRIPRVGSEKNSDRLLLSIADTARDIFSCAQVAIYSYDQDRDAVTLPAVISGEQKVKSTFYQTLLRTPDQRVPVSKLNPTSAIGKLIRGGKNEFAPDVSKNAVLSLSDTVRLEGIQSSAAVLLSIAGKNGELHKLGVLFLNYRHRHEFQVEEQNEIQLFAQSIAYALYNVQVSKELTNMQVYFEEQNWITKSQKCWSEKMSECVGGIQSTVQLIDSDLDFSILDSQVTGEIRSRLKEITEITSDIARITNYPSHGLGMKREPVEINRLVKERVSDIWKREWDNISYVRVAYNHHVETSPEPVHVQVDGEWLRYVIDLVVDIAVDNVQPYDEKAIEVGIIPRPENKLVEVVITDSAPVNEERMVAELERNVQWRVARTIMRSYEGSLEYEPDLSRRGSAYILSLPACDPPAQKQHRAGLLVEVR